MMSCWPTGLRIRPALPNQTYESSFYCISSRVLMLVSGKADRKGDPASALMTVSPVRQNDMLSL